MWQYGAPSLIPRPAQVGNQIVAFLTDSDFYSEIIQSIFLTGKAMIYSIIIASIFAYLSPTPFFRALTIFMTKFRYLTLMGWIFAFTLILKDGATVKLSLLMFGIIPFFVLSLLTIIKRIEPKEYDLCQTLKYNRWQTVYELIIYGRLEYTVETIRANFAIAWLMITLVESFSMSEGGIGVMLFRLNKYNQLDKIFALQIIIFSIGIIFDYFLQRLRYAAFPHVAKTELK